VFFCFPIFLFWSKKKTFGLNALVSEVEILAIYDYGAVRQSGMEEWNNTLSLQIQGVYEKIAAEGTTEILQNTVYLLIRIL
jgi:hypothetical protein